MDFAVAADHSLKIKESEKIDKYLDLARGLKKKAMKYERGSYTSWLWNSPQRLGKKSGGIGNLRENRDHTDRSTV